MRTAAVARAKRLRTMDEPTPPDTIHIVAYSIRRDSAEFEFWPRCGRVGADSERRKPLGSSTGGIARGLVASAYQSQTTPGSNRRCLSPGDQCCVAEGEDCGASRDCSGNRSATH